MQNCYSKPKVPPLLAETDERLTAKHIKALSFLQDIGRENKELKAKVKELEVKLTKCQKGQEKVSARAQSQEKEMMTKMMEKQKTELMQKVEEKVEAERQWEEDKIKYVTDLEDQKRENEALREQLEQYKRDTRVADLEATVSKLQEDVDKVNEQKSHLEQVNGYQLQEIEQLNCVREHNEHLREQLSEASQKNKELEFKVSRLERDLTDTGQTEQEELMGTLRTKLTLLHREKSLWTEKSKDYESEIDALREEIVKLRQALNDSERMRGDLHEQMDELLRELNALRHRVAAENNGQAFKEFVQIKRELSFLKEENTELKTKLKGKSGPVLPSLKQNVKQNGAVQSGRADRRGRESSSLTLLGRR